MKIAPSSELAMFFIIPPRREIQLVGWKLIPPPICRELTHHERVPMPFDTARTALLLGQLQRRQRHKEAAAATLREALRTFEDIGTVLWAQRARDELARVNVRPTRDQGLTPSERRVAELAASGFSNRDIAATLFISIKTVEANLGRVYRKLGVRGRVALARRLEELSGDQGR